MEGGPLRRTLGLTTFELDTNRPPEAIRVQRCAPLIGAEFWLTTESVRPSVAIPDSFGACWVEGEGSGGTIGRWWSRGEAREIESGSVHLIEPGVLYRTLELGVPVTQRTIWWTGDALERAAAEHGISGRVQWKAAGVPRSHRPQSLSRLWDALDRTDTEMVEVAYADVTRELLGLAGECAPVRRTEWRHAAVRRALTFLKARFREVVSLDELASEARLSKFHLVRCFREMTGSAPHGYQKLLRVAEARRLLQQGLPVEEAACRAGFADGSHLSRAFRAWIGVAPGAFARAFRASDPSPRAMRRSSPPTGGDGCATYLSALGVPRAVG